MARLAVAVVGGVVGNLIAPGIGGQIGFALGSAVGNAMFGPKAPDQEGPQLPDLTVKGATEGEDIVLSWGDNRIPAMILWAQDLQKHAEEEEQDAKGGSGPTYTTYNYTWTFAASFGMAGDASAAKLRRVWANKKLIYDATSGGSAVSKGYAFTFYDGTQTIPDPVIEAIVGTGNVPAYKRHIMLVGYDWNLTNEFSNRPPVIEAEIVTNGSDSKTLTTFEVSSSSNGIGRMQYSNATQTIWCSFAGNADFGRIIEIEPNTQQIIGNTAMPDGGATDVFLFSPTYQTGIGSYALVYHLYTASQDKLFVYNVEDGLELLHTETLNNNYFNLIALDETPHEIFIGGSISGVGTAVWRLAKSGYAFSQVALPANHNYIDSAGGIYLPDALSMLIPLERTTDNKIVWALYDGSTWDVTEVSTRTTTTTTLRMGAVEADDGYIYWPASESTDIVAIRLDANGAEVDDINLTDLGASGSFSAANGYPRFHYVPERRSIWFHNSSTAHEYQIDAGTLTKHASTSGQGWTLYHQESGVLWSGYANSGAGYVYANRLGIVGTNDYLIRDILDDLCGMVGVESGERDWSGVSQTVKGFVHTRQAPARNDMEPLLRYALADGVATGFKIKGVELGGSSVKTIVDGETVVGNAFSRVLTHDIRQPSFSQVQYASADNDLQPAMASQEYYNAPGDQAVSMSLPMTLDDADASEFAQILLQLTSDVQRISFRLPPKYMELEPADPITLPDGTRVKITQLDRGHNGVNEVKAVVDNPNDLVAVVTTPGANVNTQTIPASSAARLLVLDTPLLRDADADQPGPYLTGWTWGTAEPGISFHVSADNSAFAGFASLGTEPEVGTVDTVPTSVDWENWDTTNTIRVRLRTGGTLASVTDAEILAGANAFAWGKKGRWEVAQFKTATLVSTGVYDLSNLLRGRRGTNGYDDDSVSAMESHQADDWFVLLAKPDLVRHALSNADIGAERWYKAPKSGQPVSDVTAINWTVGSNPLKPYSPINPSGTKDGSDMDLAWTRRTRKGGSYGGTNTLTDNVGGPISEDSEEYTVQTLTAAGVPITDRTASTNAFTLTAAMLSSDYGAAPPTVYWRVRQNSAVNGVNGYWTANQTDYIITPAENIIAGLSPTAFWKLDETSGSTAADSSGNGNDGTYTGSPTLGQTGLTTVGTSIHCESSTADGVTIPTSIASASGTWSVVMFVHRDDALSGGNRVFYQLYGNRLIFECTGAGELKILLNDGSTDTYVTSSTGVLSANTTHAIAVRFQDEGGSNYLRAYVDGSEVASHNFGSATMQGTSSDHVIGEYGGAGWEGYIDCVAEFNGTALSTTNISDIAAARV